MRHKLIALMIVCMAALGLSVAPAWAQSSGQAQTVKQGALTVQGADADANATQNAVNANVPVVISGGGVSAGSSSANQNAGNAANASAQNTSLTLQAAQATQTGGGSSCYAGCGGGGQYQAVGQAAGTVQSADADADAKQNAVNANVPVTIAGGDVKTGSSSATQKAENEADADAKNGSLTIQAVEATQTGGGSSCKKGCGGSGQYQAVGQAALTAQDAEADADAKQNAVNGNAPVTIAGGDVKTGSSSATQNAENEADADAKNASGTIQLVSAEQTGGGSSCYAGCGGSGQYQAVGQLAVTHQDAKAEADADQNAVNGNAPVAIAGGDVETGDSKAEQDVKNEADADAKNGSLTIQAVEATQTGGGSCKSKCYSPCKYGCGGDGQAQEIGQVALTAQDAKAEADADQNAVNGNAPVAIAGDDVKTGDSKAEQDAKNEADADAENASGTIQLVSAEQTGGGSWCQKGCGGSGQYQAVGQAALTVQDAKAEADADQNAVNGNAPVAIAGDDVKTGDSKAEQDAKNEADAEAANGSLTIQAVEATQSGGSSCKSKCYDSCKSGCGGSGQSQKVGQLAATFQDAKADADADQNAVNGNAPVAIAGDDVKTGDSKAEQDAKNEADAKAENGSLTVQLAGVAQTGGGSCKDRCSDPCRDKYKKPCKDKRDDGCKSGCGSQGQLQKILQLSLTKQKADADADANQNAVNGNAPVAIAGDDVKTGDSKAEQDAENEANAKAKNKSLTAQLAFAWQSLR